MNDTNNTIIIENGDTLSELAKKYETTVKELIRLNNISDPDIIKVGDTLIIPNNNSTLKDNSDDEHPDMLKNMLDLITKNMNREKGHTDKILQELSDNLSESSESSESTCNDSIDNLNDIANSIFVNNQGENICEILTKINDNLTQLVSNK